MARRSKLNDDAPVLTDTELAEMRPAREVLSEAEFEAVSSVRGRPPAVDPKVSVTIRLDRHVVDAFKATGPGWQTRINAILVRGASRLRPSETTAIALVPSERTKSRP